MWLGWPFTRERGLLGCGRLLLAQWSEARERAAVVWAVDASSFFWLLLWLAWLGFVAAQHTVDVDVDDNGTLAVFGHWII